VLLPQPCGFEDFLAIEVDPLARDQAVADTADGGEVARHLDAALATGADPSVEVTTTPWPSNMRSRSQWTSAHVSCISATQFPIGWSPSKLRSQFDVRVGCINNAFDVARSVSLEHRSHDLDV
jgi:hypothetical protein